GLPVFVGRVPSECFGCIGMRASHKRVKTLLSCHSEGSVCLPAQAGPRNLLFSWILAKNRFFASLGMTSISLFACMGVFQADLTAARASAQQIEAPQPKSTASVEPSLAGARRLAQEGKFSEAIAQLDALAAKQPGAKGL